MDLEPFVEVNLENINESGIKALMKFRKETFDKSNILKKFSKMSLILHQMNLSDLYLMTYILVRKTKIWLRNSNLWLGKHFQLL